MQPRLTGAAASIQGANAFADETSGEFASLQTVIGVASSEQKNGFRSRASSSLRQQRLP